MEDKIWASFWAIVCVCATITIICCVHYCVKRDIKYIEAGYTRQALPGQACAYWVRP